MNLKGFCCSYTWSCSLCEGRTSFCTGYISRKLSGILFMFSTGFTSFNVLTSLSSLWTSFYAISPKINGALSVNSSSANLFVSRDINIHHKDFVIIMFLLQFPLTFPQTQKGMSLFIAQLMAILVLIGTDLVII